MMCGCPACSIKEVTKSICVHVVIKSPVRLCASYLLFLDEVMYFRMALGTSIVSSFTSTTSKELTYDSFLSPTCETQHRQLGPTFCNLSSIEETPGSNCLTWSLRKPMVRMFWCSDTPSAMVRSPKESPSSSTLGRPCSALRPAARARAPSLLLKEWISWPLKACRTPLITRKCSVGTEKVLIPH